MAGNPTVTGATALRLLDGCALHHVTGDRDQVLTALAQRVVESGHAVASLPAAVLAREQAYPTGLPMPVPAAIPHTDADHVLHPGVHRPLVEREVRCQDPVIWTGIAE